MSKPDDPKLLQSRSQPNGSAKAVEALLLSRLDKFLAVVVDARDSSQIRRRVAQRVDAVKPR